MASGAALQQLFAPSPRVAEYGLTAVSRYYYQGPYSMAVVTFGAVLTALALFGTAVCWRRRTARRLALLWAGCAALSLGSELWIGRHGYLPFAAVTHGVRVSLIMPFTWFVRIPGLSDFREANRFTELGLVPAALLAGAAVEWLRAHAKAALFPVLTLAVLEAGWPGNPGIGTMPTALPRLDGPIAAQHTRSIVVDVPFGIRGGLPVVGGSFPAESLVLATADQHPLADAFISRIPAGTLAGIEHNPFYAVLLNAQGGQHRTTAGAVHRGGGQRAPDGRGLGAGLAAEQAGAARAPADRLPVRLPGRRRAGIPAGRGPARGRGVSRGVTGANRAAGRRATVPRPARGSARAGRPRDLPVPGRTARTGSGPAGIARPARPRPRPGCPRG